MMMHLLVLFFWKCWTESLLHMLEVEHPHHNKQWSSQIKIKTYKNQVRTTAKNICYFAAHKQWVKDFISARSLNAWLKYEPPPTRVLNYFRVKCWCQTCVILLGLSRGQEFEARLSSLCHEIHKTSTKNEAIPFLIYIRVFFGLTNRAQNTFVKVTFPDVPFEKYILFETSQT